LRGDSIQFIIFDFASHLRVQNSNLYQPLIDNAKQLVCYHGDETNSLQKTVESIDRKQICLLYN